MRGKGVSFAYAEAFPGITPAYAGKSLISYLYTLYLQDHPRLCGEKQRERLKMLEKLGSPPPMRGKGCCIRIPNSFCRITPAYAGKSVHYLTTSRSI